MRIQTLAALSFVGLATAMISDQMPRREVTKSHFGAMEVTDWYRTGMDKTVYVPQKEFVKDYERQAAALGKHTTQLKVNQEKIKDDRIYKCDQRFVDGGADPQEAGYFFPTKAGTVSPNSDGPVTFANGLCFEQVTFSYAHTGDANDIGDVVITVDVEKPKTLFCKDWFLFGNAEVQHVETFFFRGTHQITLKNLSPDAKVDILTNGIQIYMFCDGYIDTFMSAFHFIQAFVGGLGTNPYLPIIGSHVPEYMENANIKFLKDSMGYDMQVRNVTSYDYDESLIQSGDFLAIMRLDGVDPIIMYGSGTHAGHSVMALRFDDGLYIIESQDGWYWPRHGIQRNKFSQWVEWAKNADFHVAHLPLNAEARAKFNETAAQEFFYQTEGLPYGYHNFLFGWVDTPVDNLPPLVPSGLIPIVFSILEDFTPSTVDIFFNQAINKRLGTVGLNIKQLSAECARRGTTIEEMMAVVEVEGWEYTGLENDGRAYVCSAYVAAVYQAAGLFLPGQINGPEFTPKDVYTLNFYDLNFTKPAACQAVDGDQPFCQFLGKYRMTLPEYSTIAPYNHMSEKCPTIAPTYDRPANC